MLINFRNAMLGGGGGAIGVPEWTVASYRPSTWVAGQNDILLGLSPSSYYFRDMGDQATATTPNVLTDGIMTSDRGGQPDRKVLWVRSDSYVEWTFTASDLYEIRVFTKWKDTGRDTVHISSIYVLKGSEWIFLCGEVNGASVSSGSYHAQAAILKNPDGLMIARGISGIYINFGPQENSAVGYVEIEALSAPSIT